jgi:hypothetical protein
MMADLRKRVQLQQNSDIITFIKKNSVASKECLSLKKSAIRHKNEVSANQTFF